MDETTRAGHELSDFEPRKIALFGAGLAAVIILVAAVSFLFLKYALVRYAGRQLPSSPLAHTREPTPEPRLQVGGVRELQQMRQEEESVLNGYAWVDKEKGIVRIPVERAMELLAEKEKGKRKK
ncbi:MAG TPA: hypothetical protein VGL11_17300 [Candidatus Binatia bacterium]|jgi:hypothetical protein